MSLVVMVLVVVMMVVGKQHMYNTISSREGVINPESPTTST